MDPDYGLDYTVEIFDSNDKATGLAFHAQIKSTDEAEIERALGAIRFGRDTADYYRSLTLPVLVVLYYAPSRQLFARWFHAYNPHLASEEGASSDAKTIRFQFDMSDGVVEGTPVLVEAGLRGYLSFSSPELSLPLAVAITSDGTDDAADRYRTAFSLRKVLESVSHLVTVEVRDPAADDACIQLGSDCTVVSLAEVASVNLDHEGPPNSDEERHAADLSLALSVALTFVGQPNVAAQIAAAVGARSRVISDPEVTMTLAGAMFRGGRIREAIELADALDSANDEDLRLAGFGLLTVLLARGDNLSDEERGLALENAEKRLRRRLDNGNRPGAASESYGLGMLRKRLKDAKSAIEAFQRAAELDDRYLQRAYFHSDLAGVLFEGREYEGAAEHYARAAELGQEDDLILALRADALLFSGQYGDALKHFGDFLSRHSEADAAEWRLKHKSLPLLIENVGDAQARQPDVAKALLGQWDFETSTDMTVEEAFEACSQAIGVDACSGEAWFRFGLLALAETGDPKHGAGFATAGAVLARNNAAAWTNAVLFADPEDERLLEDLFYAGYRHCDDGFVESVTPAMSGAEHLEGRVDRYTELLEQAVVRVDAAARMRGFTLRFLSESREIQEVVFGPGEETSASASERPDNTAWRPPPRKPKSAKRKGPGKSYGETKRRKRRRR